VGKQTEEELKQRIFKAYTEFYDNSSSDRRQVNYAKLCELVYSWCKGYIFYEETDEMGVEIVVTVERCTEKDEMPKEDFLKYLRVSLSNAYNQSIRNKVEGSVKEARIITEIKKIINIEERKGRELTNEEKVRVISEWMCISEQKARSYLKSMSREYEGSYSLKQGSDNDNKIDIINSVESHYPTPEDDLLSDNEVMIYKDVLETVLNNAQDRMKGIYRAFFTLRCIKKNKNYDKFLPMLDSEILEMYKNGGKRLTQYEIYLKYHPEDTKKRSAYSSASGLMRNFKTALEEVKKEKYPEFDF
jgi:hypothetical protein